MPDVGTLPDSAEAADQLLQTGEPSAPATEPAPAEPPPPARADQARNKQGQFTSASPPEPEPPKAGEPGAPPETPGEPAATEDEALPWTFHAEGGDFGLEGALRGDDGIFIPEAQRERTEKLLRQGLAFEGSAQRWFNEANQTRQELERNLEGARAQIEAAQAEKQHVLDHFEQLVEASQAQLAQGGVLADTPLGQWLANVAINWPVLKAESKAKGIERKYQADTEALHRLEAEREEATLQPLMLETLNSYVLHYGQQAGLDQGILEQVYVDLQQPRFRSQLFVRAPADDRRAGIRKGELVIDHSVVQQEVQRVARWVKAHPQASAAKPSAPMPPAKKPTPPPTVSATRGPSPRKPLPQPKTAEEADALLEEGGYDLD